MEQVLDKLPFEVHSKVFLLSNKQELLFYHFKNDKVSYVTLCKLYNWGSRNSRHWYEDVMLYGTPRQMKYLYNLMPKREFLERYWMECIQRDIFDSPPIPKGFDITSFYSMLAVGTFKVAQVCYDYLDNENNELEFQTCVVSCKNNYRTLEWVLQRAKTLGVRVQANKLSVAKQASDKYYDVWIKYSPSIDYNFFTKYKKSHRDEFLTTKVNYRLPCYY